MNIIPKYIDYITPFRRNKVKSMELKKLLQTQSVNYKHSDLYVKYVCIDIKKKFPPIETFDQIPRSLPYQCDSNLIKPQLHNGQRKLFLTELQFLTHNKSKYCIYAGASPGNKTYYLSTLFPDVKFILIDPNKFDIILPNLTSHRKEKHDDIIHLTHEFPTNSHVYNKPVKTWINFIKKSNYKIYIIEDYINMAYAEMFKCLDISFISDIRSNISDDDRHPGDFDIYWNSSMMFNWISVLQPELSMLKFRQIYFDKPISQSLINKQNDDFKISKEYGIDFVSDMRAKTYRMPKAKLYIQAWSPIGSTELRMWIKKKDIFKITEYDNSYLEDRMFYYNRINRGLCFHTNPNANKAINLCHCNDCALENKIWADYIKHTKDCKKKVIDLLLNLGKITFRPLTKSHFNTLYKKLDCNTFVKFVKNYEHSLKVLKNKKKIYVRHRGDSGKSGGSKKKTIKSKKKKKVKSKKM